MLTIHSCRLFGWCCECFLICGSDFNCVIGNGIQFGFGNVVYPCMPCCVLSHLLCEPQEIRAYVCLPICVSFQVSGPSKTRA
ncbi:hypothetical protein NC652_004277 [Populus alba x Populus x berolinensis]|nr:hypothetical protein NC652_004277 [Populus alba x Populus x berolinensis]